MCGHFAYRSKQRGPYRGCGEEAYRRWMEYNRKKTICGENRNSYSKTDTDATFMHMKDDHMRNGQLKPGYNVQFAVNSGFITGIGVFSNRTDFGTLIPFLSYVWHKHGKSYRNVVADSVGIRAVGHCNEQVVGLDKLDFVDCEAAVQSYGSYCAELSI